MRLATARVAGETRAVRVDGSVLADLGAPDVGALLAEPGWRERAEATAPGTLDLREVTLAPLVPRPGKVVCVGLNYAQHITEMGRELPEHPTLFAKFAEALVGPTDPVVHPAGSTALDWEAELAVVVGATVRSADEASATAAIAGFTVMNDVTARDWQYRTPQWLQGKTFEGTTPLGPFLVTTDEVPGGPRPDLLLTASVNGEAMQSARTGDLVFDPVALVQYVSAILTLRPGDVIATGTPGGVGHARSPARYLGPGDELVTCVEGIGELRNRVVAP